MIKDEYYREACEDAREMAHHGYHWTDEIVENRAAHLRSMHLPKATGTTE